tara:strand:+ start:282 stop:500 length:219 start_codon:yes stop_codon:yes gene_type:complete
LDIENVLSRFLRANLLDARTPLHDLPRLTAVVGRAAIAIKRDDAMAMAFGCNVVEGLVRSWLIGIKPTTSGL